jgi:hypothetical protein
MNPTLFNNLVLAGVVAAHIAAGWPASRAVLANVRYCAAYTVDLFVQHAGLEPR